MTNEVKYLPECIRIKPKVGANVMTAANQFDFFLDGMTVKDADMLLASLSVGGAAVEQERARFIAALMEPILQFVPYETLYDRFFMTVQIEQGSDNVVPVEDHLVSVSYSSHPQTGVFFVRPGYLFNRPTFSTWTSGIEIPWQLMAKAGWNVLQRQMNYALWDLAKQRDAAAKTVIDAAVPTSHKLTVTGGTTKASVDQVIRSSNQIGFPVKMALINPGRLMEMQSWTWGGTGFFIPPERAQELLDNLFISTYGNLKWYASPYAPTDTVYFAGDPTQIGWHQVKGTPRTDSQINIKKGIDEYSIRDAEHAYYAQSGLTLWTLAIA